MNSPEAAGAAPWTSGGGGAIGAPPPNRGTLELGLGQAESDSIRSAKGHGRVNLGPI